MSYRWMKTHQRSERYIKTIFKSLQTKQFLSLREKKVGKMHSQCGFLVAYTVLLIADCGKWRFVQVPIHSSCYSGTIGTIS